MSDKLKRHNDAVNQYAQKHRTLDEKLFNLGVELGRQLEKDNITDYRLPFFIEQENTENIAQTKATLIHKAEKLLLGVVKKAYKAQMDVSGAITIDASYSGRNDTHLSEDIVNRFFVKHTHTEQYHSGQDFTLTFLLQGNLLDIFQRHSVSPQVEITVSNNGGEEDETLYDAEDIDHQFFRINIKQHAQTTRLSVEELTAFVEDLEKNLMFLLIKGS
jgi:hypothetical protein